MFGWLSATARYDHGLVVGKFYPPHAGHHLLIGTAAAECRRVTVIVAPSSRESIPLALRLDWLRETHAPMPHVRFIGIYDDNRIDHADPAAWDAHCALFRAAAGVSRVDAVFTSEVYGKELARRFHAAHVCVDPDRLTVPVSGTAVRADPVAHWDSLAPPVRAWFARRVVVVGAESTGTTTLARALARRYRLRGGVWARTRWVAASGRELTGPAEDRAAREGGPILLCDTDAFATPSLYLLTSHDGVPFADDGRRDGGRDGPRDGRHLRARMTGQLRAELSAQPAPWIELTGPYRQRLCAAVAACDAMLARGWTLAPPLSAGSQKTVSAAGP